MGTRFVPSSTQAAIEVLAIERERTLAEQDAFKRFHTRLAAIDLSATESKSQREQRSGLQQTLVRKPRSGKRLGRAQEAYRETIMDVPHYDDEYDESLAESLAGEFGSEVASAMATSNQLTHSLREQLLTRSQRACTQRKDFLTVLAQEAEALRAVDETLTTLGATLDTLDARSLESWSWTALADNHEQLLAAEERCDRLVSKRQATLHSQRLPGPTPSDVDLEFTEYLYDSLPVTYPVLADLADFAETLQQERHRVERALHSTS